MKRLTMVVVLGSLLLGCGVQPATRASLGHAKAPAGMGARQTTLSPEARTSLQYMHDNAKRAADELPAQLPATFGPVHAAAEATIRKYYPKLNDENGEKLTPAYQEIRTHLWAMHAITGDIDAISLEGYRMALRGIQATAERYLAKP